MAVPLIIEAAINGATMPSAQPHVPRTVREIVADALACVDAGATIVHHHTDDMLLVGRHATAPYREAWTAILAAAPDAILYPTMGGGGVHTNIRERYAHVEELADLGLLRLALVDPGSVSLGGFDPDGLPMAIDLVYENTFADARYMFDVCLARGLAAHVSIFEPGFLRVALAYHACGRLPPTKIQLYFGGPTLPFGLPPTAASLDAYLAMLDGTDLPWMVGVIGGDVSAALAASAIASHATPAIESRATPSIASRARHAMESLAALAIERGGHVRVGLEDYAGSGQPRNAELVGAVVALAERHGRRVATAAEAAEILRLPRRP